MLSSFISLLALVSIAAAQSSEFGQCGGIGWSGPTVSVYNVCEELNPYFFQGSGGTGTSTAPLPTGTSTAKTNTVAKAAGKKYFGSATDNPEFTDAPYVAMLSNNAFFGQITPGNSMKWDATEPEQGTFTFSGGDAVVALAQGNSQLLRGHNCVWYNQLPSWVTSDVWTNATLTAVVQNHCGTLVSHYAGDIYAWDIINEPFNDDGTWRQDVFFNTMGSSFVDVALIAARAADPNAKLYINDYNIESTGAKSAAMLQLVSDLKSRGVPIDGVGFESHFIVGEVPSTIQQTMEQFVALGVEVAVTELDIRMTLPETDALLAQQKTDYTTVISACNAVPGCVGLSYSHLSDILDLIHRYIPGMGAACPWDDNLISKPAYDGIIAGFA
ncbi:glycoside hydrolase superfamily [Rhodocollybia butyracea]|uniref:Beta-xylanase n=1 Tax=Rhodocollybia butyracea TaxID=206335 RepID=A0A9P5PBH4_9AGAR|nr:glycoside hydrolase superfamily [Rhodocollybia butyracea]